MHFIRELADITKDDVALAGGKGASLGEMMRAGIPVPPGFVILADAPEGIDSEILRAFDRLGVPRVAVRSSASVEDGSTASWAGQFETYLNVTRDGLINAVAKCRGSVSNDRVFAYQAEKHKGSTTISIAVVVQTMVDADAAGVCFTVHPVSRNPNHMIIEACKGLGDRLVGGEVTPDGYTFDKTSNTVIDVYHASNEHVLNDDVVHELAALCHRIEDHYGFPCDIEWARKDDAFFILQSRPITTL